VIGAGRPGSLDERELTDLAAPVASGGTAEILRCRLGADTLIYKRYKPAVLGHLDTRAVHAAVAWPSRLDPAEREHLFTICAWPRAVVTRHGAVSGVVMDEAPARFRLPSGAAGPNASQDSASTSRSRTRCRVWVGCCGPCCSCTSAASSSATCSRATY
jgi:hypothetical protein